jgi:hypothetical protein
MENSYSTSTSETNNEMLGQKDVQREGSVAKAIEKQTAKLPSDFFLWTAVGAMTASLALKSVGKKHTALFIGQWTAPLLLFGIYNKIVKVAGHDRQDRGKRKGQGK